MAHVATRTVLLLTLALRALALAAPSCLAPALVVECSKFTSSAKSLSWDRLQDEDGYGTLLLQKEGRKAYTASAATGLQTNLRMESASRVLKQRVKRRHLAIVLHPNSSIGARCVLLLLIKGLGNCEDGWCVYGGLGEWTSNCAVSRRKADPRSFAEFFNEFYKLYIPQSNMSKTLRLPDGRSLHNIVDWSYPLDDAYCWILGWYDLDRKAAVNNYTYLTEVSTASCRSLEQSIPNYHQISLNGLMEESKKDTEEIDNLWASQEPAPVLHLSQDFVDGMKLHAAAKCLLAGGEGGVCDVANCALRGCRLDNDRRLPSGVVARVSVEYTPYLYPVRADITSPRSCLPDEDGYGTLLLQKEGRKVSVQVLAVDCHRPFGCWEVLSSGKMILADKALVPILEVLAKRPGFTRTTARR
ncbi:unnamed protein product [Symbiodinium natans]|uniref:Uncharacterized protein n=1 Tax=Symbiodinium natans TaxID=878477 RepID=A0A812J0M8_9DINO|nr:unnamed protein product [Symbiodinium natans]